MQLPAAFDDDNDDDDNTNNYFGINPNYPQIRVCLCILCTNVKERCGLSAFMSHADRRTSHVSCSMTQNRAIHDA